MQATTRAPSACPRPATPAAASCALPRCVRLWREEPWHTQGKQQQAYRRHLTALMRDECTLSLPVRAGWCWCQRSVAGMHILDLPARSPGLAAAARILWLPLPQVRLSCLACKAPLPDAAAGETGASTSLCAHCREQVRCALPLACMATWLMGRDGGCCTRCRTTPCASPLSVPCSRHLVEPPHAAGMQAGARFKRALPKRQVQRSTRRY